MPINNPDILYPLLDDISLKIRHLNHRVSCVMDDAEHIMLVSTDQTNNAAFDTHHTANLKEQDHDKVAYWNGETTNMLNKANSLMRNVQQLHTKLLGIKKACDQSLAFWNNEHSKAMAWLERAKARLANAIHNLNIAQSRLRSAEAELSAAQSALSRCRGSYTTDSKGNRHYHDCSSHERRVSNARYNVQRAEEECRRWEIEKQNAEAEVAQATARVNRCIRSLEIVRQAINNNTLCLQITSEADNYCQRSLEEIRSAADTVARARTNNQQQDVLVQENRSHLSIAHQASNDASNNFRQANKLSGDVQLYGNLAGEEMDKKVDLLKEFSLSSL